MTAADEILGRIIGWAEREATVRALILLGSRARSDMPADEWSDTDLVVFVTDVDRWLADGSWLDDIGTVIVTFVEATGLEGVSERRVLFAPAVDVDLPMVSVERIAEMTGPEHLLPVLARGYQLLVDKDDRLAGFEQRAAAADPRALHRAARWPADPAEVSNLVADYLYHAVWVTKKLRRGELSVAVECQNAYQAATLRRFVEWQAKARSGGEANTYYDGRFLETWAPAETVSALAASQAHYDHADLARAVVEGLDVFRTLATEVANAAATTYPDRAHASVREWVEMTLRDRTT